MQISGTVKDTEGTPVADATLSLKQTYGGDYVKTLTAKTANNGTFTFEADKTKLELTISADGFYDQYYAVGTGSDQAVINVTLEKMPADKITMAFVRVEAAVEGQDPVVTYVTSATNLTFSVYNETKKKAITGFKVQYPFLVLGADSANAGDVIRIYVADETGQFTAEDVRTTLDETRCGSVEGTLLQNGCIRLSAITPADSDASQITVMVFDKDGNLAEAGSTDHSYTTNPLSAGKYTVILIERSSLLPGVDTISRLAELGLAENTDYLKKSATVNNGVVTVLSDNSVPDFDESKLYYTVENNTRVWANCNRAVTGQYVTVRAMYEIGEKYKASGETLKLEIPEGMSFIESSLTLGSRTSACTVKEENGKVSVSVPVNAKKGTVRFYVVPTTAGAKTIHGFLSFTEGKNAVTLPIGAATVQVSAATISVPERTGFKKVTAYGRASSGTALANCEITVYDNGTAVGTTTSGKNGSWSLEFDLVDPRKYSAHGIYAEIKSADLDTIIETDTAVLIYSIN